MSGAYQDCVSMGTHGGSKPLTGLELNLSVHIINIKIPITYMSTREKRYNYFFWPSAEVHRCHTEAVLRDLAEKFTDVSQELLLFQLSQKKKKIPL